MLELKDVTLVAVSSVKIEETKKALETSSENILFGSVKFLTDVDTAGNYETVRIQRINSVDEYSHFIVYELHKYIQTKYCLICQYDGYVYDYTKWDANFLKYDYIGAPWPLPTDSFSYRDSFNNIVRVGNGGFSLRTKRLLELPSKLCMVWEPFHGFYNEDGFFVCKNRHIFEHQGCSFADIDVAKFFSKETNIPENAGIVTFGIHGVK